MKKLFLLFLGISSQLLLSGQPDPEPDNDSTVQFQWDPDKKEWVNYAYTNRNYDTYGNPIEEISYHWSGGGIFGVEGWYLHGKRTMEYGAAGNLIEEASYRYDGWTNEWNRVIRRTREYDTAGNPTGETVYNGYFYDGNRWAEDRRFIWEYDSAGNRIKETKYRKDFVTAPWVEKEQGFWTYDPEGNLIEETKYKRHAGSEEWINLSRIEYRYDDRGRLIEKSPYVWGDEINDWEGQPIECDYGEGCRGGKYVYQFDSTGHLAESLWYTWDELENDWTDPRKSTYVYDTCGNLSRYYQANAGSWSTPAIRSDYKYTGNGLLSEKISYGWEPDSGVWIKAMKSEYFWCPFRPMAVDEHCADCNVIGPIRTKVELPPDYTGVSLTGEGVDTLFSIDTITGELLVNHPEELDFEKTPVYRLPLVAHFEDSTWISTYKWVLTVYVRNINDNPVVTADTAFVIELCNDPVTVVGKVSSSDRDGDLDPVEYSIVSGDPEDRFSIDRTTGTLSISSREGSWADYPIPVVLTVQVSDGLFTDESEITIYLVVNHFYIKTVDRSTRESLEHIFIKYNNFETYTDLRGLLFIRNNDRQVFKYKAGNSHYFSREESVLLTSCDTFVIELDRKYANIEFLVQDGNGPVTNALIDLGETEVTTDQDGLAVFGQLRAGEIYNYSIEKEGYGALFDSLSLERDTLVQISLATTDTKEFVKEDIRIYPVPAHDILHIDSEKPCARIVIRDLSGRTVKDVPGNEHRTGLGMLKPGIYVLQLRMNDGSVFSRKISKQ